MPEPDSLMFLINPSTTNAGQLSWEAFENTSAMVHILIHCFIAQGYIKDCTFEELLSDASPLCCLTFPVEGLIENIKIACFDIFPIVEGVNSIFIFLRSSNLIPSVVLVVEFVII